MLRGQPLLFLALRGQQGRGLQVQRVLPLLFQGQPGQREQGCLGLLAPRLRFQALRVRPVLRLPLLDRQALREPRGLV